MTYVLFMGRTEVTMVKMLRFWVPDIFINPGKCWSCEHTIFGYCVPFRFSVIQHL